MERKICIKCSDEKSLEEYHKDKRNKDGRQGVCKDCRNKHKKAWRESYKDKHGKPESFKYNRTHLEEQAKSRAKRIGRNKGIVSHRKWKPCSDCGGTFPPVCMDFDHVRGEKDLSICRMVNQGVSVKRLLAELDKCELVCSNCHRIRTANRDKPWEEELRKYDRTKWWIPQGFEFTELEYLGHVCSETLQ